MNGFKVKMLSVATVACGFMAAGCQSTDKHGDPCWPDRYANEARQLTVAAFQPQVENGHILDHTIWNLHFEYGSDQMNGAGMDKLDQLARRRPMPDVHLFLQTTRDIAYDPEKPADHAAKRIDLDNKRVAAVQKYLKATLTGRELTFDIQIHDRAYPGIDVTPGIGPRVYIPTPQDRSRGANVPATPVSGSGGAASGGPTSPPPSGGSGSSGPKM